MVGADADLQLYDLATLKEVMPWEGHRGWVDFVAFTPDGKSLLTGSAAKNPYSQEFATWDVSTWKRSQLVSSRTPSWPNLGTPNPQQTMYVGKSSSDQLVLFDLRNGKLLGPLTPSLKHDPKSGGFFSPSGNIYIDVAAPKKVSLR